MLALQSKIEAHHITTIYFHHEQELLKFLLLQKIALTHLAIIQTSKRQNSCGS